MSIHNYEVLDIHVLKCEDINIQSRIQCMVPLKTVSPCYQVGIIKPSCWHYNDLMSLQYCTDHAAVSFYVNVACLG